MPYCMYCGKEIESGTMCEDCRRKFQGEEQTSYCMYCGKKINGGKVCDDCRKKMQGGLQSNWDWQNDGNWQGGPAPDGNWQRGPALNENWQRGPAPGGNPQTDWNWQQDQSLSGNQQSFREMWTAFKNRVGLGEPETNDTDYYEHGLPIVPDCIGADEGEVPVKQYNAAILRTRLKFQRSEGRLQVTNKRVIFRATGRSFAGRTTIQQEFAIDEIAGIKFRKDHRFSLMNFIGTLLLGEIFGSLGFFLISRIMFGSSEVLTGILGFVFAVFCAVPLFTVYKHFWLKHMAMSFGSMCLVFAVLASGASFLWILVILDFILLVVNAWFIWFLPNLVIAVETKGGSPAVEIRRDEKGIVHRENYTGFAEVIPWQDTEVMIIELWAMVSDIQKYGDRAVAKWSGGSRNG